MKQIGNDVISQSSFYVIKLTTVHSFTTHDVEWGFQALPEKHVATTIKFIYWSHKNIGNYVIAQSSFYVIKLTTVHSFRTRDVEWGFGKVLNGSVELGKAPTYPRGESYRL